MNKPEHRKAERRNETFVVSLAVVAPLELDGRTVNLSAAGVLVTAQGRIRVTLAMKGQLYRGVLVRAVPGNDGTMDYAIELTEIVGGSGPVTAVPDPSAPPGDHVTR